jgi:hypothetical protein
MTDNIEVRNPTESLLKYYDRFYATDVPKKDKKRLKNELMYQLFIKPKKDSPYESPTTLNNTDREPNKIHQMDLLFLPYDSSQLPKNATKEEKKKDAYKYGLTIVDCGSRDTACIPLKDKTSATVAKAVKQFYSDKTNPFKLPKTIEVDAGTEFQGDFAKYFKDKGVDFRVAQAGRSRQQALVESRNSVIARAVMRNMILSELQTGEESRDWVDYLKDLLVLLNKHYHRDPVKLTHKEITADVRAKPKTELLEVGTKVRVELDKPIDLMGNRQTGSFREGDIRWSLNPSSVERLQLIPNQPPLYKVKGYDALYTRNQLQVVPAISNVPPIRGEYVFEDIRDKRKNKKNQVEYLVKFEGYDNPEWVLRKDLLKTDAGSKAVREFDGKQ